MIKAIVWDSKRGWRALIAGEFYHWDGFHRKWIKSFFTNLAEQTFEDERNCGRLYGVKIDYSKIRIR